MNFGELLLSFIAVTVIFACIGLWWSLWQERRRDD